MAIGAWRRRRDDAVKAAEDNKKITRSAQSQPVTGNAARHIGLPSRSDNTEHFQGPLLAPYISAPPTDRPTDRDRSFDF